MTSSVKSTCVNAIGWLKLFTFLTIVVLRYGAMRLNEVALNLLWQFQVLLIPQLEVELYSTLCGDKCRIDLGLTDNSYASSRRRDSESHL